VELLFSRGLVKLLFATETFAVGINMPTKTVVFTSYTKHSEGGQRMLRSDEYIQMAGRAGRRGKDTRGFVLYLPDREPSTLEEVRRMMTGGQQRVQSKMDFGYDFLIQTCNGHDLDWMTILKRSYWYTQYLEGVEQERAELLKVRAEQQDLHIRQDMLEELFVRERLETQIRELTNAKRKDAQRRLEAWKAEHEGTRWESAWKLMSRWKSLQAQIDSLQESIEDAEHVDRAILPRLEYLKEHGFLDAPLGPIAANVHEGHTLMMPIAFQSRAFHALSLDQLLGVLSLFGTSESEREEELTLKDCEHLEDETIATVQAFVGNQVAPLVASEKVPSSSAYWRLDCTWADVVVRWVKGDDAFQICSDYGLYEGNFVRAILKVANLADEWITVATVTKDLDQLERLRSVRQTLVRGIVVPDSLYLRI
jgi:superfamily II RNA helicase